MKAWYVNVEGRRHQIHWEPAGRLVRFADYNYQSVPRHDGERDRDYRYTHGGAVYQAACERIWKAEETGEVPVYGIEGGL